MFVFFEKASPILSTYLKKRDNTESVKQLPYNRSEKRRKLTNTEHSDPDSYSWYVMRVAVLRLAQQKLQHFLQLCGIEMSGEFRARR